ncbi:hypothetical protein J6590_004386 [Homalodisca vitripennis]|nr:hypothetical protein J6590_004386 [Homalodisca vitripennis]
MAEQPSVDSVRMLSLAPVHLPLTSDSFAYLQTNMTPYCRTLCQRQIPDAAQKGRTQVGSFSHVIRPRLWAIVTAGRGAQELTFCNGIHLPPPTLTIVGSSTGLCEDLIKQNKGESRYSTRSMVLIKSATVTDRIRTCTISNSDSESNVLDHSDIGTPIKTSIKNSTMNSAYKLLQGILNNAELVTSLTSLFVLLQLHLSLSSSTFCGLATLCSERTQRRPSLALTLDPYHNDHALQTTMTPDSRSDSSAALRGRRTGAQLNSHTDSTLPTIANKMQPFSHAERNIAPPSSCVSGIAGARRCHIIPVTNHAAQNPPFRGVKSLYSCIGNRISVITLNISR